MRLVLGVFALAVLGSTAFAVSELRALKRSRVASLQPPSAGSAAETPLAEPIVAATAQAAPRELSTWKGALPFGGVAGTPEPESEDSVGESDSSDVPDSIDRCPDDEDDLDGEDGCPQPSERLIVKMGDDGRERRIIIRLSEIIY